jgi:hypothetical protein
LRTFISNHWYVTKPFIRSGFFTKQQQALIHDIFTGLINPEWYGRFLKQIKDDTYGQDWGEEQSIALFGAPQAGPFQFVLTGRHMTLRADGGSEGRMAFGGPILYGHAADGLATETPNHPGNVFWPQAEAANRVSRMLDPAQRGRAVVPQLPSEAAIGHQGPQQSLPGIAVAELSAEQRDALREVLLALLDPFRPEDQRRVLECLSKQGGLERCSLSFYPDGRLGRDDTCDNWRLEGPAFVWYFRGSPHVHVWVNVAETPEVPLNSRVCFVVDPWPEPIRPARPPAPKLVAITTVKNEFDIIEAFVRHNLALVDHLVIADNGSTDGTLGLLRTLEREGLSLTIIEDPTTGKYMSQRMTRLMRDHAAARHDADWIVPLDADEFLVVPEGGSLIPQGASPDKVLLLPWRTYVPHKSDDPAKLNPVLRMRHHLVREGAPYFKAVVPRTLAALSEAVLVQGSHTLTIHGQEATSSILEGAWLAHFPIRGPAQYLAKVAVSELQYRTMGKHPAAVQSFHLKSAYALLKRDLSAFAESIFEAAHRFALPPNFVFQPETVDDPLPYLGGPLLHTAKVENQARGWYAVLSFAEDLAARYGALSAGLTPAERVELEQQLNLLMRSETTARERLLLQERLELMKKQAVLVRELDEQRQRSERAEQRVRDDSREIEALRRSWRWRVGSLMVRPLSLARRGFRAVRRRLPRSR